MNGEPIPREEDVRGQKLNALHHATGRLLQLESASKNPRILIDGDIEVPWPEDIKSQIEARIVTKMAEIADEIKDLQESH